MTGLLWGARSIAVWILRLGALAQAANQVQRGHRARLTSSALPANVHCVTQCGSARSVASLTGRAS